MTLMTPLPLAHGLHWRRLAKCRLRRIFLGNLSYFFFLVIRLAVLVCGQHTRSVYQRPACIKHKKAVDSRFVECGLELGSDCRTSWSPNNVSVPFKFLTSWSVSIMTNVVVFTPKCILCWTSNYCSSTLTHQSSHLSVWNWDKVSF